MLCRIPCITIWLFAPFGRATACGPTRPTQHAKQEAPGAWGWTGGGVEEAEEKKQVNKALKANKDRVDKTVLTLMMIVQDPSSVHRGMPLELLRGPLQTIVNDPVAFGLRRPGASRDDESDSESQEEAVELTGGFISRLHQQDRVVDRCRS